MKILAIDPGNIQSAYVCWDGQDILDKGIKENNELIELLANFDVNHLFIEMIASYGMPVGQTVFDTCVWIGRFLEHSYGHRRTTLVYRKDIKIHLCGSMKAKDGNIMQALIDRFGNVNEHGKYAKGTKKNPGFFYGFSADMWAAFAVAVYSFDTWQK